MTGGKLAFPPIFAGLVPNRFPRLLCCATQILVMSAQVGWRHKVAVSGQEGEGWDGLFSGYTDFRLARDDYKAMVLPVLVV